MSDSFLDEVIQPNQVSARSARRAQREERMRRRRRRRRRNVLALVISLGLLGGIGYGVVTYVLPVLSDFGSPGEQQLQDYPGPGHGSVEVNIPAGATGSAMAQALHDAGVVASTRAFTTAFAANPDAERIQPGTYRLALEMRGQDAVAALLESANRVQMRVTIPEGQRVEQILERLSSVTAVPVEEFEAAMEDTEATGLPGAADGSYEGWLFPLTYDFEPGTEAAEMIAQLVGQTVAVLEEREVPESEWETVLNKASLVERESPNAEASPMMARAIENRLEQGWPLQIDAAVAYGLDKSGMELTRADISSDATDNPYNTYAHNGLPPTPIASPGLDSIEAVLNPADGPWMFWVTVNLDTGETKFSETYSEHQQYVAELRRWEAENL
ncbi:endolytic transglycosylase MltG [Cellulomonas bogoriensis]|uniref:Endolytic murein transglycosylase n=1 Tax=Cellulomonas bogoriensis 69B4 = DSM 16987 TaxID=1386082 RepID=A0A0A0C269_9CELL|nr:endolytic transglycosylase MltG [Cellulomonas bogoriensis]KGM14266.1 aminodeoxychorismate lyase [Cellulomonas bogoriensis 69B4 = DSM 16987]